MITGFARYGILVCITKPYPPADLCQMVTGRILAVVYQQTGTKGTGMHPYKDHTGKSGFIER